MSEHATRDEVCEEFRKNVYEVADAVDPDEKYDWRSLFAGYALAKGATVEEADDWSRHARYTLGIA